MEYILFAGISLGVFFCAFFQPFPYDPFDFSDRVLFIAGLGMIVFVLLVFVRWVLKWVFLKNVESSHAKVPPWVFGKIFWVLNSTTYAFYLKYVVTLKRKNNKYWLTLQDYNDPIPVSRQYLISTRKGLSAIRVE